ncbi:MAG: DUF4256 domain-containing protein [Candidatus Eisenbacteria bacterium]|nr:DUF4256 domain-containing protein [Candidatus Eisenbacteria bacterium]
MRRRTEVKKLGAKQKAELLGTLKARFEENKSRHKGISWEKVEAKLEANPLKLATIAEMERTGGEPDVVSYDKKAGEYAFFDCAKESPSERRSLCYDAEALASRKQNKPKGSAVKMAADMGAELLSEEEYRMLQTLGDYDTKTSSWLRTPEKIRSLGGAIFGDYRFDTVFVYHNGAESYYAARGFRCSVRV